MLWDGAYGDLRAFAHRSSDAETIQEHSLPLEGLRGRARMACVAQQLCLTHTHHPPHPPFPAFFFSSPPAFPGVCSSIKGAERRAHGQCE